MRQCDWAFSYYPDDVMRHPRHMRAVWDSDPRLVKGNLDPSVVKQEKRRFFNFIYR